MQTGPDGSAVTLPGDVEVAVGRYLASVDNAAPGLVEALYATGSVALGDYQPAISDVDLVAICRDSTPEEIGVLGEVHRPSRPNVATLYATRDDLRRDPSVLSLPGSVDGVFRAEGAFEANPVVWRVLSTRTIPVRGMPLTGGDVWFDADALRRWNLANLDSYWTEWVQFARTREGTEFRVRHEYHFQWLVLGVPRLHHTIATLDVTSKTGAGRYALEVAPTQWHIIIEAAMALRADRDASLPLSNDVLWRGAIDLSAWFIEDAHRIS